ncbi:hypothetical protein LENED_003815 [Lentinula edodes]|uniref:Uncharacterized protein n=1 Tax=Lentinula edodes TaxID=5353 RepID=A0A1Q3E4M0_LENED|nr:hypothetical protein LENED_003815 [Lentinula edodes]
MTRVALAIARSEEPWTGCPEAGSAGDSSEELIFVLVFVPSVVEDVVVDVSKLVFMDNCGGAGNTGDDTAEKPAAEEFIVLIVNIVIHQWRGFIS